MTRPPPPLQMFWLRRIRLLRAQRRWRQLLDEHEQLRQNLSELAQQAEAQQVAGIRCLRHAQAGASNYAIVMRRASAHHTQAASLANQVEVLSMQLDQMARHLRSARTTLEKAKRLLEETSPR